MYTTKYQTNLLVNSSLIIHVLQCHVSNYSEKIICSLSWLILYVKVSNTHSNSQLLSELPSMATCVANHAAHLPSMGLCMWV